MASIHLTTWRPSTCDCEIVYEWDPSHSEDERLHKIVSVKHCGSDHPVAVTGNVLEGSAFHRHHVLTINGAEHWDRVLKANPHWGVEK